MNMITDFLHDDRCKLSSGLPCKGTACQWWNQTKCGADDQEHFERLLKAEIEKLREECVR